MCLQSERRGLTKTQGACDEAIHGKHFFTAFSPLLSLTKGPVAYKLTSPCTYTLLTGIKSMAFFFGATSAQASRPKSQGKKGANVREEESDESNGKETSSSQVASTSNQEWLSNHPTVKDKKLSPAINYWIALTTLNGAPANPIYIHHTLLD